MTKQQYKTLQEASKILLDFSENNMGNCKRFAEEYNFACQSCLVHELATKFNSFVNSWLDEPEE